MKKFLVYNFSGELDEVSHLFPSERLARIAGVVRHHGGAATILDRADFADLDLFGKDFMQNLGGLSFSESNGRYEEGVEKEARHIADGCFDTILMNLWHGTGFKFSMDLAKMLKELVPEIEILGIGQKVDWFKEHILALSGESLDGLITGLGFDAVAGLVGGEDIGVVPGVICRADGRIRTNDRESIDVDDYAGPVYDGAVYLNIDSKVPVFSITLSNQACRSRCVFCVRPANYGRSVRRRSIERVVGELEDLCFNKGATHFRVEDSTPPRNALTDLAGAVCDSRLAGRITLSAFARADVNSTEDFDLLKRAGFISLFFGMESLDDETLVRLKKGTTYPAIRAAIERAHAAGIYTVGSFIFPTPGETERSMETTLSRILKLKPHLDSVLVLPAGVYPASEWGQHPEESGIRLADDYVAEALIYPIKYEVPMRHWKPFPFTYRLMGKGAEETTFDDIVTFHEQFVLRIKNEFDIPRVPDYYFLLAHMIGAEPSDVARGIVGHIMGRDYAGLQEMLRR